MNNSVSTLSSTPANGDMSQATVFAGPFDVRYRRFIAMGAVYTGAPVGTLQLLGFNSTPAPSTATGWFSVGSPVAVSAAGNQLWDIIDTGLLWLAVLYTKTSGTGTLVVTASAKD